ncbi:hypothetical protein GDO86_016397, partial [Hymenochirus boettgeri]
FQEFPKSDDVTVCFSVEELDSLEDGQKERNINIKTKIHNSPNLVGYLYVKPEIVPRIHRGEEMCVSSDLYTEKRRNRARFLSGGSISNSEELHHSLGTRTEQSFHSERQRSMPDLHKSPVRWSRSALEEEVPNEKGSTDCIASTTKQEDNSFAVGRQKNSRTKTFWCGECGDCFKEHSLFLEHQISHSGQKSNFSKEQQISVSNKYQEIKMAKDYGSNAQCSREFTNLSKPPTNRRTPTEAKSYTCKVCGKSFTQNASLIVHQRTHTGERPHLCKVCGKSFISGSYLVMHQRVHTGERPYACNECGKRFISSSNLIIHQRVHTGEKPYLCTECGKCFGHSSHLVRHQKVHTGERPYTCAECGKSFSRSSHLVRHQIIHMRNPPNQTV